MRSEVRGVTPESNRWLSSQTTTRGGAGRADQASRVHAVGVNPGQKLKLMTALTRQPGGDLELSFSSYGLGSAYAAPTKGWGKAKRIGAAFASAEERGDAESILTAAAEHFGLIERAERDDGTAEAGSWLGEMSGGDIAADPAPEGTTAAADRGSDRLFDTSETQLRRLVFNAWDPNGEWPIARVLQRRIERDGGRMDVEATSRMLDRGVGYIEQSHDPRVVLRIGGLVRTSGAERYVAAFITVLQLAYARYRDAEDDDTPTLSDEALRVELSMDPGLTRRLYALVEGEWFLLEGGTTYPDGTWRRDISPNVRYFRDVQTGEDYVQAANDLVRPYVSEPDVPLREQPPPMAEAPSALTQQGIQIFQTVIFGGSAAIGINPSVVVNVTPGDLPSLMSFLEQHGVEPSDQKAFADAIAADAEDHDGEKPGRRVTAWLGRVGAKLAASGVRVGEATVALLIATAVARYLALA
jgi:hypothetical protein